MHLKIVLFVAVCVVGLSLGLDWGARDGKNDHDRYRRDNRRCHPHGENCLFGESCCNDERCCHQTLLRAIVSGETGGCRSRCEHF